MTNNQLLNDLISLKANMQEALEEAHAYTKLHEVDSEWWNFYVGKVDGISSYGYKIQQLIEKHQND